MEDNIINCIIKIVELEKENKLTIENLEQIKGVGPWTIKSLKIPEDDCTNPASRIC